MNRREFLELAALPLAQLLDQKDLRRSPGAVLAVDGRRLDDVELIRDWTGPLCRSRLVNRGRSAVRIREAVLVDVELPFPPATRLYGEGFQMLTQTVARSGRPSTSVNIPTRSITASRRPKVRAPSMVCSRSRRRGATRRCVRLRRARDSADDSSCTTRAALKGCATSTEQECATSKPQRPHS